MNPQCMQDILLHGGAITAAHDLTVVILESVTRQWPQECPGTPSLQPSFVGDGSPAQVCLHWNIRLLSTTHLDFLLPPSLLHSLLLLIF